MGFSSGDEIEKAAFKVPHSSLTALNPNEDFLLPSNADIDTPATARGIFKYPQISTRCFLHFIDVEKM